MMTTTSARFGAHDAPADKRYDPRYDPLVADDPGAGRAAVRDAFAAVWKAIPDAQWENGRHHVDGDFGVSEWTFTGTAADGSRIETDGIDVFTFRDGKIHLKNVFRKARPNLPAAT